MKEHSYYKKDEIKARGNSKYTWIHIFEEGFPYELEVIKVQDDADNTFNEWLALQRHKASNRLIFEKLLTSIEVLYEAEVSLCYRLWHLNDHKESVEHSYEDNCVKITDLVYEHSAIIKEAQSYITLFLNQLRHDDIETLMATTEFLEGSVLRGKSKKVIEKVQPIIDSLK